MRLLLIASDDKIFSGYKYFSKALNALKIETLCIHKLEYCTLSGCYPLKKIAIPNFLERVSDKIPIPKFLKIIKEFNPNIVFMNFTNYIAFSYIAFLIKLFNRPLIIHLLSDPWVEYSWNMALYPSVTSRIYTCYLHSKINSSIKRANLILTNSKWLQKKVNEHIPNLPTYVLHSGINPEKWLPNDNIKLLNIKHPAVVSLFHFNIYPKVVGLIKFIRVIKKMPDVNFYFAGSGPYFNLINQNRPSNMYLLGRISSLGVKKLLASGDIFIHPSGLDVLPRSVREASLMEKPIIASNIGGIQELIEDNKTGYLIDINDVDKWIEKIQFLLDNPSVSKIFGKNARRYIIENFTWEKSAKNFEKILKNFMYE